MSTTTRCSPTLYRVTGPTLALVVTGSDKTWYVEAETGLTLQLVATATSRTRALTLARRLADAS